MAMLSRSGGLGTTASRLLKAGKLALCPVSEAFEHDPHLSQFGLEFSTSLVGGSAI